MRKSLRWALSLSVLIGTVAPTGVATAADTDTGSTAVVDSQSTDIKDRILAIPGMSLIEEKPYMRLPLLRPELQAADRPPAPVGRHVRPADLRPPQGHEPPDRLPYQRLLAEYDTEPRRADQDHRRQPGLHGVPLLHAVPSAARRLVEARHLAGGQRPAPDLHRAEEDLRPEVALHRRLQGRYDRHLLRALLPA